MSENGEQVARADKVPNRRFGVFSGFLIGVVIALYLLLVGGLAYGVVDGWIVDFWGKVTGPQASIIVGGFTVVASLTAAVLLPFMLEDRMRNVNDLAREAKAYLEGDLRRTTDEANRILKVMERQAYRAEGILKPGQTIHVRDNDHANEIIVELYEAARSFCHRKLRSKRYLRGATRTEIAKQQDMSRAYLKMLLHYEVLAQDEYDLVEEIRAKRRSWVTPVSGNDVNRLNSALLEFLDKEERDALPDNGD